MSQRPLRLIRSVDLEPTLGPYRDWVHGIEFEVGGPFDTAWIGDASWKCRISAAVPALPAFPVAAVSSSPFSSCLALDRYLIAAV